MDDNNTKKKNMDNVHKLFQLVQSGLMSTAQFKQLTKRRIMIAGRKDYSRYTGRMLRQIRAKQAREALDNHYKHGGAPVDESRCVDLHMEGAQ